MHNQQNSAPQTAHIIWLHDPSSIFTINTLHLGHGFISSPVKSKKKKDKVIIIYIEYNNNKKN